MDLKLAGRRALVTGASKGIGRGIALRLAQEGCRLVLVARGASDLGAVQRELAQAGCTDVETVAMDLAQGALIPPLAARFADIDILVNNAGAIPAGDLQAMDEAAWRAAWDLKVFGYINMRRAFYAGMKAKGGGVIINIIGAAAHLKLPQYICGVTGNAALTAFTQSLGSASHRDNIRVIAINPGAIATERYEVLQRERAGRELGDAERWREFAKTWPFGRPGASDEIAAAVAFLASDLSGYTSGADVVIDGGLSAAKM
jgi:NAD(P)-dependent dehydrogenase (short-subunit alcohol dehydrogenase family)